MKKKKKKAEKKAAKKKAAKKAAKKLAPKVVKTPPPVNAVNWFEIPAANFDRAVMFYSTIFGIKMAISEMNGVKMAFFNSANGGVGGAVTHHPDGMPSAQGSLVYLNGGKDLASVLNRVEPAGGHVVVPKTLINKDLGYFAIFTDSEGNKVALHSMK